MSGHLVVSDKHHKIVSALAMKRRKDIGVTTEELLEESPEFKEEFVKNG